MNVAIVNKYYFPDGGPERYLFAVQRLLEARGHKVVPLALRLSGSVPTPYSRYFLPPPAGEGAPRYEGFGLGLAGRAQLLGRAAHWPLARRRMAEVVRREGIEAVYLLNIANYISPSVVAGAADAGARVVMRLSDYHFACASYLCFRRGRVCEDCLGGFPWLGVVRRCLHGSFALSAARCLTMAAHRLTGAYRRVDAFAAPSRHMAEALVHWGAPKRRVHCLPSFVPLDEYKPKFKPGGYALYFGRLIPEKGVDVLLKAWATNCGASVPLAEGSKRLAPQGGASVPLAQASRRLAPQNLAGGDACATLPPLLIVGRGDEESALRRLADELDLGNVRFVGFQELPELRETVRNAAFVVAPSLWHDNSPMSVYEAMALGKAVVASDLGGLRDQVFHGETGLLVPPGDPGALAAAAMRLWRDPGEAEAMGRAGRRRMEERFSPERHAEALEALLRGHPPPGD